MVQYLFLLCLYFNSVKVFSQVINDSIITYVDSINGYYQFNQNKNLVLQDFLNYRSSLKLSEADGFILLNNTSDEIGYIHYRYLQSFNNIPIENSMFIMHTNYSGKLLYGNGFLIKNLNLYATPTITENNAINIAINQVSATSYFWQDSTLENSLKEETNNPDTSYYPTAQLIIAKTDLLLDNSPQNFRLCYKVPIMALVPRESYYIYVDAITGSVVRQTLASNTCISQKPLIYVENYIQRNTNLLYKDTSEATIRQTHATNNKELSNCDNDCVQADANLLYYGSQYIYTAEAYHDLGLCDWRLKDVCTGTYLYVTNKNGNNYWDGTNNWTDNNDKPGTTSLWCLERAHDYYRFTFGRNSYDGNYSQVNIYAHDNNFSNSAWDLNGKFIRLGVIDNKDLTTLDIIGHELTHGVTQSTANLQYIGEEGALDESFSDIFGTMIEFYGKTNYNTGLSTNYLIGEDAVSGCYLERNMSDPKSLCQPNTYKGQNWDWQGNEHTNDGVQNFWFYLLAEGGSGRIDDIPTNPTYCIDGIGRDKAAAICYRSLTTKLTPGSNYAVARFYSILSAQELYGTYSNEVAQVINAWYAVGVGPCFLGYIEYNNLTVSGTQIITHNSSICFNNFNETSTGNITITSNRKILMSSTSKASSGSYFHAYLAPGCMGGAKMTYDYNDYSDENNLDDDLKVYNNENTNIKLTPNPNNGIFTITVSGISDIISKIKIYSTLGNQIYQSECNANSVTVNISSYPKDIYIVKTTTSQGKVYVGKIVVQ